MSKQIKLQRTGAAPVVFDGEQIGDWSTVDAGNERRRGHVIRLYRVNSAQAVYAAAIEYVSDYREPSLHYVLIAKDAHDLAHQLTIWSAGPDVAAGVTGFVPKGDLCDLRGHIALSLKNALRTVVSTILEGIPEAWEHL